LIDYGACCCS